MDLSNAQRVKKVAYEVLLKGDDAVVEKLNGAMAEIKADGTLTKLSEEFFGADISQQK